MLRPSSSTGGSALGGSLAVLYIYHMHSHGTDYPAGVEAAIASLITAGLGYVVEVVAEIFAQFGFSPKRRKGD